MTADDLVELLTAIIGPTSIREAIAEYVDEREDDRALTDQQLALLVRFVAGERLQAPPSSPVGLQMATPEPEAVQLDLEGMTLY